MIRKAAVKDLETITEIVSKVVPIMQESGNDQWNESYPGYNNFLKDIEAGELYVIEGEHKTVKAFICINKEQPPEYADIKWKYNRPALVIHRSAVDPEHQGEGLAKELFKFAEERAAELNFDYIRSDTSTQNNSMNGLFKKFNYEFAGRFEFPGYKYSYNGYEKLLGSKDKKYER